MEKHFLDEIYTEAIESVIAEKMLKENEIERFLKEQPAHCSNAPKHIMAQTELRAPKTVIHFHYKVLIGRRSFLDEDDNY